MLIHVNSVFELPILTRKKSEGLVFNVISKRLSYAKIILGSFGVNFFLNFVSDQLNFMLISFYLWTGPCWEMGWGEGIGGCWWPFRNTKEKPMVKKSIFHF